MFLNNPISTTLADADHIVAASKKVKIVMAYLLRFLPAYRETFKAITEGARGKLVSGFFSVRVPTGFIKDHPGADHLGWYSDPIKGGGGGFFDHGVHLTDFLRWLFKSKPASVAGTIGNLTYSELGTDDYGIATYTLKKGATVTMESTWHIGGWAGGSIWRHPPRTVPNPLHHGDAGLHERNPRVAGRGGTFAVPFT
jgi:predicted dehydrogenase